MNGFYFKFLSRQDLQDKQAFFTVSGRNRENYIRLRRKTGSHTFADCVVVQKSRAGHRMARRSFSEDGCPPDSDYRAPRNTAGTVAGPTLALNYKDGNAAILTVGAAFQPRFALLLEQRTVEYRTAECRRKELLAIYNRTESIANMEILKVE